MIACDTPDIAAVIKNAVAGARGQMRATRGREDRQPVITPTRAWSCPESQAAPSRSRRLVIRFGDPRRHDNQDENGIAVAVGHQSRPKSP